MHNFVQRIMRGVIFCLVSIAVTACAGLSDLADNEQAAQFPALKNQALDESLPRIDAIRLRVARNAMANGDYDTAIRFFESVRDSVPYHPAPLVGIANAHMAAGSHTEAILAYRDVLVKYPAHEQALDGIGRSLVTTGYYREAIEHFDRLLAETQSAAVHNRTGVAHDLMGDGERAQKHYLAALQIDPESISARNNLALSLAISELYVDAVKHMERVAAHSEATDKHQQNLAFIYGMAGQDDEAVAALTQSGLSTPEITKNRALFDHIRVLAKAGNRAEILAYLRTGKDIGDPALAEKVAGPTDPSAVPSAAMAPAMTDGDSAQPGPKAPMASAPQTEKVLPPKPLKNSEVVPEKTVPKPTRMAKVSDPVKTTPKKSEPARAASVEPAQDGIYRVQLASYRSAKGAERGRKILRSILRDDAPDLEILVRQKRRTNKRAFDYRIRTPQVSNREAAGEICAKIQEAGHPDCLIILHNPLRWAALKTATPPDDAIQHTYRVQLASFRTTRGAIKGHAILTKLLGNRAESLDILVRKSRRSSQSAFDYRIRTGAIKSRDEGTRLCEALKEAGHQGCLLIQHNDLLWENIAAATERDKASLDSPQPPTWVVAGHAASPAIELPGSIIVEAGHTPSEALDDRVPVTAIPMVNI